MFDWVIIYLTQYFLVIAASTYSEPGVINKA